MPKVKAWRPKLIALLETSPVIRRADHPCLVRRIDSALRKGDLVSVLPGIYARAGEQADEQVRVAALFARHPDAVLTGAIAARLDWWPELRADKVSAAGVHARRRPGFRFTEDQIVESAIRQLAGGVRIASRARVVLDLIPDLGGRAIDEALRRRAVNLPELWRALGEAPRRAGNELRRQLLQDSADEPWSPAERQAHIALRRAGVGGWRTNVEVRFAANKYFLDIGFEAVRLGIEIDGYEHHRSAAAFHYDRMRDADLAIADWQIVRLPAGLTDEADRFAHIVVQLLRARSLALGLPTSPLSWTSGPCRTSTPSRKPSRKRVPARRPG